MSAMLAGTILAVHVLIIAFNIAGLIVVPVGARRGWGFVHMPLWRLVHVGSLGVTAVQAALGRLCFLTVWQAETSSQLGETEPIIMRWINALVYWPIPLEAFTAIYLAVLAYAITLLWVVPLRRQRQ